jgi:hypothetical protein
MVFFLWVPSCTQNSLPGKDHDDAFTTTAHILIIMRKKGETMIHLSITKLECSNRELQAIGSRPDGPRSFHALNFYKEKYCLLI